jgi:UDPglucose 6-dehydrogenase
MDLRIKIYGFGWVGKAMKELFPRSAVHDPGQALTAEIKADVAFVCVPTPNLPDGSLDISIVEGVVRQAEEDFIIIRSTVQPGTCDRLREETGKEIVFMPEYLGETVAHPLLDDKNARFLIIGGSPEGRRKAIELFQEVYNANIKIRQVSLLEAEIIKLSENRAIMFKVAQCQELYDACEAAGVDYYTVRDAVYGDDPRFSLDFTFVYPDDRGANSKCIPKDVKAWAAWAKDPKLTKAMLDYNQGLINA